MFRNILDGFHHAGKQISVGGFAWCKRDAAVTHQGRGYTVPADGCHQWIPTDLGVQVRVEIDETRGYHMTLCIDLFLAFPLDLADGGNQTVINCEITRDGLGACAVDNVSISNNDVVSHKFLRVRRAWGPSAGARPPNKLSCVTFKSEGRLT